MLITDCSITDYIDLNIIISFTFCMSHKNDIHILTRSVHLIDESIKQIDISFFYFIKKNECQIFALNLICFGVLFFLIAIVRAEMNNYCRMLFSVYLLNLYVLIIVRIGMRGYIKENQYTTGHRFKK